MIEGLLRLLGTGSLIAALAWLGFVASIPVEPATNIVVQAEDSGADATSERPRSMSTQERNDVFYQAILDRPVFEITRRPIDPEAEELEPEPEPIPKPVVEVPEPAPQLPNVSLLGVMSTGSRIQALISVDGGELLWLGKGDNIGGWIITGAGKDWLELAADNNKVRLELFE